MFNTDFGQYISGRSGWMLYTYPWVDTVPHFRKIGTPRGRFAGLGYMLESLLRSRGGYQLVGLVGTSSLPCKVVLPVPTAFCCSLAGNITVRIAAGWFRCRIWYVTAAALLHDICLSVQELDRGRVSSARPWRRQTSQLWSVTRLDGNGNVLEPSDMMECGL